MHRHGRRQILEMTIISHRRYYRVKQFHDDSQITPRLVSFSATPPSCRRAKKNSICYGNNTHELSFMASRRLKNAFVYCSAMQPQPYFTWLARSLIHYLPPSALSPWTYGVLKSMLSTYAKNKYQHSFIRPMPVIVGHHGPPLDAHSLITASYIHYDDTAEFVPRDAACAPSSRWPISRAACFSFRVDHVFLDQQNANKHENKIPTRCLIICNHCLHAYHAHHASATILY